MPKEIEEFINYAIEEDYISVEEAGTWTDEQKENYYRKCMAHEPNED